jgi:hypothetical protein
VLLKRHHEDALVVQSKKERSYSTNRIKKVFIRLRAWLKVLSSNSIATKKQKKKERKLL